MNNKDKLKKYLEEINPVFWEKEGKVSFEKLSDREVELLLEMCEEKLNYDEVIKQLAYLTDSVKAKQIEDEYKKEVDEADRQYEEDIRRIEEEQDIAMDSIDEEEMNEISEISENVANITRTIVDSQKYKEEKAKLEDDNKTTSDQSSVTSD